MLMMFLSLSLVALSLRSFYAALIFWPPNNAAGFELPHFENSHDDLIKVLTKC